MAQRRDRDDSPEPKGPVSPQLILAVIVIALLVVFVFQNTSSTQVRFLIPKVKTPLWVALFASMVLGGIAGALLSRRKR